MYEERKVSKMSIQPRNAGKSWTNQEEEELLRNIQQYRGSVGEIAEVHGRSVVAINMRIAIIIRKLVDSQGMDRKSVANLFFKSSEQIDEVLQNNNNKKNNNNHSTNQMNEIAVRLDHIEFLLDKILKKQIKIINAQKKKKDMKL